MHPARSLVLFTTLSGAGFGALAWLGLLAPLGLVRGDPRLALVGGGLALALVVAGLACSTFHLRHPERAWRALSQWRSSWLSREGVLALATFVPALVFLGGWAIGELSPVVRMAGVATAAMSLATISCTAMIYRSLWTVPLWHNGWTVPVFLALGLASGGLVACTAVALNGDALAWTPALPLGVLAALAGVAALKLGAGRALAAAQPASDAAGAIGLSGRASTVHALELPSTSETWLQREMAFRVARRHAAKLRRIAAWAGLGGAPLLLVAACWLPEGPACAAAAVCAALLGLLAVAIDRWLFFAEAQHKMTLYFGADRV